MDEPTGLTGNVRGRVLATPVDGCDSRLVNRYLLPPMFSAHALSGDSDRHRGPRAFLGISLLFLLHDCQPLAL